MTTWQPPWIECWDLTVPSDEVPRALRELADRLEGEPDVALMGLWSTGFAEIGEADLQVIVNRDHNPPGQTYCDVHGCRSRWTREHAHNIASDATAVTS